MKRWLLFFAWMVVGSAAASLGCGGNVVFEGPTNGAGAGGAGAGGAGVGGGGTGASGGGGSTSLGSCTAAEIELLNSATPLGLVNPPESPFEATVVEVFDDTLSFSPGPNGEIGTFSFAGKPLTAYFQPGDTVTVGHQDDWDFIVGNEVLAVYEGFGWIPPQAIPAVPWTKSPELRFVTECAFPDDFGDCGQPAGDVQVLALRVGPDGASTDIPIGGTAAYSAFAFSNLLSGAWPGYSSDDCIVEAGFWSTLTAVGPIGK